MLFLFGTVGLQIQEHLPCYLFPGNLFLYPEFIMVISEDIPIGVLLLLLDETFDIQWTELFLVLHVLLG